MADYSDTFSRKFYLDISIEDLLPQIYERNVIKYVLDEEVKESALAGDTYLHVQFDRNDILQQYDQDLRLYIHKQNYERVIPKALPAQLEKAVLTYRNLMAIIKSKPTDSLVYPLLLRTVHDRVINSILLS